MQRDSLKSLLVRETFKGFIIGFIISCLSILLDMVFSNTSFIATLANHLQSFPHLILDTSPFMLGFYTYYKTSQYIKIIKEKETELLEGNQRIDKIIDFIEKIRGGEENSHYELRDEFDKLGIALNALQETIRKNKEEEEARKKEELQRSWINEGLAIFGDILRNENNDIEKLSNSIISKLVNYIDANQGGFFIINDSNPSDKHFQMTACFAYDRKRFANKRIEWGEGFIGTAAMEHDYILLENVPASYVHITSGLGKATPNCMLIMPLKTIDDVYGVIELAAFKPFDSYQMQFIEKLSENIASTLASVKINANNAKLLLESREKAAALARNEEAVRQNMLELQSAQEEAARQSEKFIEFTNTVNHTLIRAEYSTEGTLIYANTNFLRKLGYEGNAEVEGKHISIFISDKDREWFFKIWDNLARGGKHFEGNMKHVSKQNKDLWTMATYTCMRHPDGSIEKILFLGLDITEQKEQSLNFEGQIEALNRSNIKAEFSAEAEFIDCNKAFLEVFGFEQINDIEDRTLFDIIDRLELVEFKRHWSSILKGETYQQTHKCIAHDNKNIWLKITLSSVFDMYGEVSKVIFLAQDSTKEKVMEIEMQRQNHDLKLKEELLKNSESELSMKLDKAKREMSIQFREIEKIKNRTEATLEGFIDAILTINQRGRIEFFNKAAEDLWGYSKADVIGKTISILFSPSSIEKNEFIKCLVDTKKNKIVGQRQEILILSKQGEEKSVLALISLAKVDNEITYTAFIQNIEVELF